MHYTCKRGTCGEASATPQALVRQLREKVVGPGKPPPEVENMSTTKVAQQTLPYCTGHEAWYLSVSTE